MASMSLQAAYDQARQSLESNDLDRAIGLAQHILDKFPDNLEAYRILGEAYLANRQLDRAYESFERVLRSDPENIPAHVGLGITAERQGKLDRAIGEFEQALEIKPDMTELRSQLLRLYSEGFGSENAQLRLSRAGLARLYAKGHMLPQAIAEFRQVINDQPDRFDAMVALAEALWRDGQEDEAIDLCRDILAVRPESLKANLLLGFLLSSSGRPEGERYWQAATRMDPYHSVAQALFETLPQEQEEPPALDEWDEAAWRGRRAADQQEQIAATRPMEAVTPSGTPAEPAPIFGAGWLDEPAPAAPVSVGTSSSSSETDDFLASLLALDNPPPPPPSSTDVSLSEEELELDADMTPFSLDDLDSGFESGTPAKPADQPAASAPSAANEPTMTPFSLSDLGLSDEEIASMNDLNAPAAPVEPPRLHDPSATAQFSLSELGLSDEEITGFDRPAASVNPQSADSDIEPALTPFSLSDLGLSDEEIAGLDSLQTEAQPSSPVIPSQQSPSEPAQQTDEAGDLPADLQPFSFDDLDLSAESDTSERTGGLPSSLQPFSLEDAPPQRPRVAGFGVPEPTEDQDLDTSEEEGTAAELRGFSWQQATQKPETGFAKPPREDPLAGDVSIFSKLKQQHDSQPQPPDQPLPPVSIEPDEHLGLFSLDDISLREEAEEQLAQSQAPEQDAPETARPEIENLEDALASGQVQPFSFADLGLSDDEIAALGVDDAPAPPASSQAQPKAQEQPAEIENLEDALASGQVQPFSFADLGLSEEEMAMLEGAAPEAPAAPEPPSAPASPQIENLEDALASGQVQPFSLSDLGLSDDEIAAMNLGEPEAPEAPEAPAAGQPVQSGASNNEFDLEPPSEPTEATRGSGDDEAMLASDLKPFSLTDLGLSDEEIEALGLDSAAELEDTGDVGLGLTEEELEGLDGGDLNWSAQPPSAQSSAPADLPAEVPTAPADFQTTSGDLIVDRLIALGHQQGYIDISDIIANFDDPESEAARIEEIGMRLHEAKIEIRDGDEVIDMDAEYADEQHDVDQLGAAPTDASNAPRTPQMSRDLDLVADDLDETRGAPAEQPARGEPDMTPFSLADLGLTDEEIAALGLDTPAAAGDQPAPTGAPAADPAITQQFEALEPPPEQPAADPAITQQFEALEPPPEQPAGEAAVPAEPQSDAPDMTPFSLADLGLTDEEIAALGLDTPAAASNEPATTEAPATDAAITQQFEALEPAAEQPAAELPSDEPSMTPFSLTDLGLTDEEIAALGLEPSADAASSEADHTSDIQMAAPEQHAPNDTEASDRDILHALLDHTEQQEAVAPEPAPAHEEAAPEAAPEQVAEPTPAQEDTPAPVPAAAVPSAREPAPPASTKPESSAAPSSSAGNEVLDLFLHQLEAEPDNDVLRLSVARAGTQIGMIDVAVQQYKYLIRHSRLLDDVVGELQDLIADNDDARVLQRLHRTLGDALSKQGRLREAIEEYSWTLGRPHGTR